MQHNQAPRAEVSLKIPFHRVLPTAHVIGTTRRESFEGAHHGRRQSASLDAAALYCKHPQSNACVFLSGRKHSNGSIHRYKYRVGDVITEHQHLTTPVPRRLSPVFLNPLAWLLAPCSTALRASRFAPKKCALLGTAMRETNQLQRVRRATADSPLTGRPL